MFGTLGNEVSFTVSFSIASVRDAFVVCGSMYGLLKLLCKSSPIDKQELKDAAVQAGLHDDELIGTLFILYMILSAIPGISASTNQALRHLFKCKDCRPDKSQLSELSKQTSSSSSSSAVTNTQPTNQHENRSVMTFVMRLFNITKRICLSLAVQVVASSVNTRQSQSHVRLLTLLSVAVFFLFVEAGGSLSLSRVD